MALADFDALRTAIAAPSYWAQYNKAFSTIASSEDWGGISALRLGDYPVAIAANPTTAVALSNADAGGIPHPASSGTMILTRVQRGPRGTSDSDDVPAGFLLIDRLGHSGGLSGTDTGTQTTNLPTAALTRYTSGVGVMIGVHVWTSLGSTDTVMTISYTNTTPTSGRTARVVIAGSPAQHTFYMAGLQAGDLGVTSVESVTLSPSTGTAGNFGVVLFKPLAILPKLDDIAAPSIVGWNTGIHSDAFLELLMLQCDYTSGAPDACAVLGFVDV